MKPIIIAVALLLLAGLMPAQTKDPKPQTLTYSVLINGHSVGNAEYTRTLTAKSREKKLKVTLIQGEQTATILLSSLSALDGTPIQRDFNSDFGGVVKYYSAKITGGKAVISGLESEVKQSSIAEAPKDAHLADPTENWFLTTKPKDKQVEVFTSFNIQTQMWTATKVAYVGDEEVAIGDAKYQTHHLHIENLDGHVDLYLDDTGMPVVIDQGTLRMERKPE